MTCIHIFWSPSRSLLVSDAASISSQKIKQCKIEPNLSLCFYPVHIGSFSWFHRKNSVKIKKKNGDNSKRGERKANGSSNGLYYIAE